MTGLLLAALPLLEPGAWTAAPSDGVSAQVSEDNGALRLDVDFHGGGGYAVIRRQVDLDLPENYAISFRVRGSVPPNNLEMKLIDRGGDNVWWRNQRDFPFGPDWRTVRIKKRQIEFAWGPERREHPSHVAAMEFAVTAGRGGRGSVWFEGLVLTELPPDAPYRGTPTLSATSSDPEHPPAAAMDGDAKTFWRSAPPGPEGETLTVDFGVPREFGGLILDWENNDVARDYTVELSLDGAEWSSVRRVVGTKGGRNWIATPDAEARYLRLALRQPWGGGSFAVREMAVQPLAFSETPNAFVEALAKESPRGLYPRSFSGEQVYWTVVGEDGAPEEALLSEDGAVEVGQGSFSIEPFLYTEDGFKSWADVTATQTLAEGSLPVPTVTWKAGDVRLDITAWVAQGRLFAGYRVSSISGKPREVTLALVVRPFQVNPPSQFLNGPGGVSPIRTLAWEDEGLRVNGTRWVRRLDGGDWITAPFDAVTPGDFARGVCRGGGSEWNWGAMKEDPTGLASASTVARGTVAEGNQLRVVLEVPLQDGVATGSEVPLDEAIAAWRGKLGGYALRLPPQAKAIADTVRSNLAYILINRDGAAIQPGSRAYRRSWIRDGSLTSSALARLGHVEEAKAFVRWFAPYQYPDGKVPCCVDWRGADPVPEHDSHGELIFAIAEVWRYTKDRAFLEEMFPHVERAVAAMERLRETQKAPYAGLLPQSISHEGYSDKPVHSYWDDFFALRGYKDAVVIAEALARHEEATRFAGFRDAFQRALMASVKQTMVENGIDYIPGSVEHHDFDATSTTIALEPVDAAGALPPGALELTFDRYWKEFVARRQGKTWEAYTPYEWRTVGAMVRLGWKERAHEAIDWFFSHRRPMGWNQWAEVVGREERKPRFLGDMPHTWCGSDFIRSILDLFWYQEGEALVVGAGIPQDWARASGGVGATLPTPYGTLDLQVTETGSLVTLDLKTGLAPPSGGILLRSPTPSPIRSARVNGSEVRPEADGSVRVHATPARVEIRHAR